MSSALRLKSQQSARGVKSLKYFNKLRGKFFGRANPKKPVSTFWITVLTCSLGWKPRSTNMLRIMHCVCGPALPAALLLIGMSVMGITDAAAQGSPEARQACTPDAMRLCSEFTSDVSQTTKCMMAKRAQLSPECRAAMAHGTSHRAYRHYYRHYRHCTHGYCR